MRQCTLAASSVTLAESTLCSPEGSKTVGPMMSDADGIVEFRTRCMLLNLYSDKFTKLDDSIVNYCQLALGSRLHVSCNTA
jgi:hypothetical protein